MNTFWPRSVSRNSMNARAAFGLRAPARMAIGSGVTNAFFGATNLRSKPASFSSNAIYDGTANPAVYSPFATTVGTSRLRAVKCPVLAASFLSHSQPLSSPYIDRITSYVAFDDDERVGAHCATSPLSLGFSRSSHSLRSEEHTSELQSLAYLVCRLLLEKKKKTDLHNILTKNKAR